MKLKRIILKILLVVCLIIVGLAIYLYLWWNEEPVISVDYVAKFNEMRKPADYRPEDDGASLFVEAGAMMWKANQEDPEPRIKWYSHVSYDSPWDSSVVWPADMNDRERSTMQSWLSRRAEIFAKVDEAMAKKCFWMKWPRPGPSFGLWDLDGVDLGSIREALMERGRIKACDGQVRDGLADIFKASDIRMCFGQRLSDAEWVSELFKSNRLCLTILVAASRSPMNTDELGWAAAQIERVGRENQPQESVFDSARFYFLDTVQQNFSDDGHGNGRISLKVLYTFGGPCEGTRNLWHFVTARWYLKTEDRLATVARYDRMMDAVRKAIEIEPWQLGQRQDLLSSLENQINANLFMVFGWHGKQIVDRFFLHKATVAGTVATLQVLRYKTATGALPDGWEDLVTEGYMVEPPRDIYSGKPPIYKKMADAFTVYSVGENGIDDGGVEYQDIVFWPVKRSEPKHGFPYE